MKMQMVFLSESKNEQVARACVAAFMLAKDPSVEEVNDVKTAVSEAVTNCVVHAYPEGPGDVILECSFEDDYILVSVTDYGVGIENVDEARKPFFTTKSDRERSGLGFTVIRSFMDEVEVRSEKGSGTSVFMKKRIV